MKKLKKIKQLKNNYIYTKFHSKMKTKILLSLLLISSFAANAQNDNPYAIFGHKTNVVYETKVKDFFIIPNNDPSSKTKAIAFNVDEGYILFLGSNDSILSRTKIQPDQLLRWLSIDPLANEYPSISPYAFVANNCINAIDPDGRKIVFVNGYYNTGSLSGLAGSVGGQGYWGTDLISGAQTFFGDKKTGFVDGRGAWNSTGSERFDAGYAYAKANLTTITAGMVEGETVKIVSHSMGGAYSEGMIKYLQEQKIAVEQVVHLSPADPSGFTASSAPTMQFNLENDGVLLYKNFGENYMIPGVDRYGIASTARGKSDDLQLSHIDTKINNIWGMVGDLKNIQMNITGNTMSTPFGTFTGPSNSYNSTGNSNGTQFNILNIGGTDYKGTSAPNNFIGPLQY
ncbi:MAG: hypothetical protein KA713_09650 [Chryseotalea sp. WA131a]|nr:MAG: hypothetical protein KA713_09650 [Chryseotalea sp. WA131a]